MILFRRGGRNKHGISEKRGASQALSKVKRDLFNAGRSAEPERKTGQVHV